MSNIHDRFSTVALTYDDVLLVPGFSQTLPRDTETKTILTKNIGLNIPLVSAAMDTVTEAGLAIAMALEGGLGFIHKNMSIERQAIQVRKVKRSQSGLILDPVTLDINSTAGDAVKIMNENKIGGIPVIESDNKLVGIITNTGGPAVIATDILVDAGLTLPPLSEKTKNLLNEKLYPEATVSNPVDVLATGTAEHYLANGRSWGDAGPKLAVREILDSLDRDSILDQAKEQGEALKQSIIQKAEADAEALRAQAKRTAENEAKAALEGMRAQMADMVVEAARKMIEDKLTDQDQEKLVDEYLTKVVLN